MVQQVPPPPSTSSGQAGKPRKPRHDEWTREKMAGFLRELAATQSVAAAAYGRYRLTTPTASLKPAPSRQVARLDPLHQVLAHDAVPLGG
jgi:hypothetical protein